MGEKYTEIIRQVSTPWRVRKRGKLYYKKSLGIFAWQTWQRSGALGKYRAACFLKTGHSTQD
jgi:hypothetical protein